MDMAGTGVSHIAARNITIETQSIAAMIPWWNLVPKPLFAELRESEYPGGMAHGCELETSVLLYLRGDLVQMEHAACDIPVQRSEYLTGTCKRRHPCSSRSSSAGTQRPERLATPPRRPWKKDADFWKR